MYAKINGGTAEKFPYSFGDLRKDNPNVSFPRNITQSIRQRYGMQSVFTVDDPSYDPTTQKIVEATTPTRETNGVYTEEDAPLPNMVGESIYTGRWVLTKTVVALTDEQIADATAAKATEMRKKRDELISATDYFALTDVTMDAAMTTYRQALRDISTHENFPYLTDEDWPVAP